MTIKGPDRLIRPFALCNAVRAWAGTDDQREISETIRARFPYLGGLTNRRSQNVREAVLLLSAKRAKLGCRLPALSLELKVTIAFLLILASALVGAATCFVFTVWALVLISPLIAILSAIVLRAYEFGMMAGVTVIAICLAVCQLAYLAATYFLHARDVSSQDQIDGEPGKAGEQKIRSQHK